MRQGNGRPLDVPEAVRKKAAALGPRGERWLQSLPDLIFSLEGDWGLTVGASLHGGSASYVAAATTADGADAVLKLQMPGYASIADEIKVLRLADGRGYAHLLRHDEERGAILQERLGPQLAQMGLSVQQQMTIICATLQNAWIDTPEAAGFQTGAAKARWLREFIQETWQATDRPCSERVIDQAVTFSHTREAAFEPERSLLVHGDVHSQNTLARLAADGSVTADFALVDPDGLFADRAYDLAMLTRDWAEDLLVGDPLKLGQERCAYLSHLTGENPEAIWQWGFIEHVSTGLFLIQVSFEGEGRDFLRVAEAWARP
jgi:streptomycin 6-kinase